METKLKKKQKILVVDDNSENIRVIGSILRENDFQVGFATGGQQTLEILNSREEEYDLVLLDVNMPGINGMEVCAAIRQNHFLKDLPVIFLTANAEPEQIIKGFAVGGQDYVTKPFHPGELLARINTHLELKDSRRQLQQMNVVLEEKVRERTRELSEANQKLKETNQELERLDMAKSDFLKLISHEINTPLNGIIGFGQLLREDLKSSEYFESIEYLMESAERLHQFAKDSLEITRMRTSPETYQKREVDLLKILKEVIATHSKMLEEKNLHLEFIVAAENHLIEGNEGLLGICMMHILRNAIHYSSRGDEIIIETKSDAQHITIVFNDFGAGFSETALHTLFKTFSSGEKHVDKNKGLGLSLVKMIADFHHAQIMISNKKGDGAQVALLFDKIDSR